MKVIISHDVDHITVWEHKKDSILLKHLVRNIIEYSLGYSSFSELHHRFKDILNNKWQNLEALIKFNKEKNIPATFFFGVSKGKGLCYDLSDALYWMRYVHQNGFEIGVHGVAFSNYPDIKMEHDRFQRLSGLNQFGIRIHYLRSEEKTTEFLERADYLFDSSIYAMINPFKKGKLWEFPLHIMDGYVICNKARWQNQNLTQVKESTRRILDTCCSENIEYFNVLFHDRYFSESYKTWREWFIWLIDYVKDNRLEIVNYKWSIEELEHSVTSLCR